MNLTITEPVQGEIIWRRPHKKGQPRRTQAACANKEKCAHYENLGEPAKLNRENKGPLCYRCQERRADEMLITKARKRKDGLTLKNLRRLKDERKTTYPKVSARCHELGVPIGVCSLSNWGRLTHQANRKQAFTIAFILETTIEELTGESE